ncbi:MAG TPA: IclR family transcriptional regulator, partial [Egibacteraceae bacterium]|nr:IclR family transcriptional regulator [Egibacteraceae bacterium]
MERIHAVTGETVFLCVRRGRDAVCIERIDGRRVQSLALRIGSALPLHAGAAPRVLLAYAPPATWDQYLAEAPLERFTDATPVTAEQLRPLLEQVRASGVAVSNEDVTPGIAALGVPVFDHRSEVVASISISGLVAGILGSDADKLRDMLVEAGHEVSRQLGHARDLQSTAKE